MIEYGGFCISDFPGICSEAPGEITEILRDLEQGGYVGVEEKDARLENGMEYNHLLMRKGKDKLQYLLYMISWKIKSGLVYMFLSPEQLKKMYPRMTRYKILLPTGLLWQVISFPVKKLASGALKRDVRSESQMLGGNSASWVQLFKDLEML